MSRVIICALLAALALMPARAQEAAKLPETEAGRRVAAYFKAYNTGEDAAMRSFFEANVAPELLQKRPVEVRLGVYKQMRDEFGDLAARRVVGASETEIKILAQASKGGWVEMVFMFEPQPPHKFFGLRIEEALPPTGDAGAPPLAVDLVEQPVHLLYAPGALQLQLQLGQLAQEVLQVRQELVERRV